MTESFDFKRNCVTCEYKCDIFKLLTKEELETINENRSSTFYKPREVIFKQGAPTSHIIFLVKGLVKIYVEGIDGKELIFAITKPSQYITGPGLYYNKKYNYSAQALTDTVCCFVEGDVFKELINNNRNFSNGFITEFCRRSIGTMNSFVNLTQKKMHGRLADAILYLSNDVYNSDNFHLHLNKKELGELSNMTRESTIRILNEFQKENVIAIDGHQFNILHKKKLLDISKKG